MEYRPTLYYKTDEERLNAIVEEILEEFPNLGKDKAMEAAKLERPFGPAHEDWEQVADYENHINRLIDIVIVTEGNRECEDSYEKACRDLVANYNSWRKDFSYSNPEEQPVFLVMREFYLHMNDKNSPLITINNASIQIRKAAKEKTRRKKAEMFASQFPELEEVAYQVIKEEEENDIWLRFQENDLVRLVSALKMIEGNPKYVESYNNVLLKLKAMYVKWLDEDAKYKTVEQKYVMEMMKSLEQHLSDPNSPILTFVEIKNRALESKKMDH